MFVKPDSSAAMAAFLAKGGSVKRIDTPSDADRVARAMIQLTPDPAVTLAMTLIADISEEST